MNGVIEGPRYLPGQLVIARWTHCVVTSVRPPSGDGQRMYDVVTLDGKRHLYVDVPEYAMSPDRPLTQSGVPLTQSE